VISAAHKGGETVDLDPLLLAGVVWGVFVFLTRSWREGAPFCSREVLDLGGALCVRFVFRDERVASAATQSG
jgi:hypothetical protein